MGRAGNRNIAVTSKPPNSAAVKTRTLSIGGRRELRRRLAKAPFALRVILKCRRQILRGKLRPQRVAKIKFRIGEVPQQEIADALLAARADQQIRIRHAREPEPVRDRRLVDGGGGEVACRSFCCQRAASLRNVPAATVGNRYRQGKSRVVLR